MIMAKLAPKPVPDIHPNGESVQRLDNVATAAGVSLAALAAAAETCLATVRHAYFAHRGGHSHKTYTADLNLQGGCGPDVEEAVRAARRAGQIISRAADRITRIPSDRPSSNVTL